MMEWKSVDIPNLQMVLLEEYHVKLGVEVVSFQEVRNAIISSRKEEMI